MSDELQEGVDTQTIDYDNLTLPDPDAKQENEQPESEEQQETEDKERCKHRAAYAGCKRL